MSRIVNVLNTEYAINSAGFVLNISDCKYQPVFKMDGEDYILHNMGKGDTVRISVPLLLMFVHEVFLLPPKFWGDVIVGYKDGNKSNCDISNLYPIYLKQIEDEENPGYYYIPGYESNTVNKEGVVFRKKRKTFYQPYLGNAPHQDGFYPFSRLDNVKGDERRSIHVLLGLVFKNPPNNYPELCVDHNNGNKFDFSLDNLSWVTHSKNSQLAYDVQKLRNDSLPILVWDKKENIISEYVSQSQFAKKINVNSKYISGAFSKYNQTYANRWVIKDKNDLRTFNQIINSKIVTVSKASRLLARNIVTKKINSFESISECVSKLGVSPKAVRKSINGFPKSISKGFQFKIDNDGEWYNFNMYDVEIFKRGLQPSTVVYLLKELDTGIENIYYGSADICTLTGANERTIYVCAKNGKILHRKYSVIKLN